jgi:hypothetical protein
MKAKRWPQGFDGEPIRVRLREVFGTACCDCLLAHKRAIIRRGRFFYVYAWRYPEATRALRGWKKRGRKKRT